MFDAMAAALKKHMKHKLGGDKQVVNDHDEDDKSSDRAPQIGGEHGDAMHGAQPGQIGSQPPGAPNPGGHDDVAAQIMQALHGNGPQPGKSNTLGNIAKSANAEKMASIMKHKKV